MMTRLMIALIAGVFATTSAHAAETIACLDATNQPQTVSPTYPCPVQSAATAPAVKGFGTLSASAASARLSTLTADGAGVVWPTTPGMVYVINASGSAGVVYVCPLGGTCSAATGLPIAPGGWYGFYKPASTMTVIAATTATVSAQW